MKKLLLALMVVSSVAFADCNDPKNAEKVVGMLKSHNKTAVQVNYTADKADCAATCKANILALDKNITVTLNEEKSGSGLCRFAKPGHN
jgi:hypothetical protein